MPAVRVLLGAALALLGACGDGRAPPPVPATGPRPPLGWVDVRLGQGEGLLVSSPGPWRALDAAGRQVATGARLAEAALRMQDGQLAVGEVVLGPPPLALGPTGEEPLTCNGVRYRGWLHLQDGGGAGGAPLPRVVNRLPVDDYLKGVLPAEMPARFGMAALMAQAVAARSYALAEAERRGWLYADVRSQAYSGHDGETWMGSRAVEQTAGQVLVHGGKIVPAWFHSACGGATAAAQDVFDDPPPGVMDRAVACPDCRRAPTWSWERTVSEERVCGAAGLSPPLQAVTCDPGLFPGRPRTVTVRAGGEERTLRAVDFRARVSAGRPWDEQVLSTYWREPPRPVDGGLFVHGGGWGHGVGLCQHGAAGYAARGASYRAILRRYYPGAELVRLQ